MSRKNRYYPPEFKQEALGLLATGEYNMAQLERELGITSGLLRLWKRNAELRGEYASPNKKPMTMAAIGNTGHAVGWLPTRLNKDLIQSRRSWPVPQCPKELRF